jgi:hypothetical protein
MATAASVTVSETCQTQVIDYAVLQAHTRLLFLHDAGKHLDRHFIQSGSPAVTLEKTTLLDQNHATYQLLVSASGTMIFHLSETELHTLVTQIAGRRIAQAQQELLQVQGVQGVSIQPAHQGDVALPTDSNQIHIVVS